MPLHCLPNNSLHRWGPSLSAACGGNSASGCRAYGLLVSQLDPSIKRSQRETSSPCPKQKTAFPFAFITPSGSMCPEIRSEDPLTPRQAHNGLAYCLPLPLSHVHTKTTTQLPFFPWASNWMSIAHDWTPHSLSTSPSSQSSCEDKRGRKIPCNLSLNSLEAGGDANNNTK